MKQAIRFWLIGLAICFFGFCLNCCIGATLTGPENADVGRLVTIESNVEGDWLVYPPNTVDIAKDSSRKKLYMVARQEGEYIIIFVGIENGEAVITQIPIFIGEVPNPNPTPSPSPNPNNNNLSKMTPEDKAAVVYSLQIVVSGVENGTILTANGCRSAFKQALMAKGKVCDGRTCYLRKSLSDIADELTERTNFDSAETVKDSFELFLKEIQGNG